MKHFSASTSLHAVAAHDGVRLAIEYVPLTGLKAPDRVVRRHTQRQLKALERSLKDFGAIIPAVISADGTIIVGMAIIEAARRIGLTDFPVVRITHLDDHQLRLFRIAHTKLSEGAEWDLDAVRLEFAEIALERPDLKLGSSGFCIAERESSSNAIGSRKWRISTTSPRFGPTRFRGRVTSGPAAATGSSVATLPIRRWSRRQLPANRCGQLLRICPTTSRSAAMSRAWQGQA